MQTYTNYSVGSDDGKGISFKREKIDFIGPTFTIKFWHIGIIAVFIICFIFSNIYLNIPSRIKTLFTVVANESSPTVPETQASYSEPVFADGFVFKYSNTRTLTREEVLAFQNAKNPTFQRILRMAINEIYARKGQAFRIGEINDNYYQQYEWYVKTAKHAVDWSEFNEYEKENLRLLISIEEEYGFR